MVLAYVKQPNNIKYRRYYDSRHLGIAYSNSKWIILLNIGTDLENVILLYSFSQRSSSFTFTHRIEPQSNYKQSVKIAGFEFSKVVELNRAPFNIPKIPKNFPLNEQERILYTWPISLTSVTFPTWFPVVLFGFYPVLTFYRGPLRRWRQRRMGSCMNCGYNLTGNESGVCPECGTEIKTWHPSCINTPPLSMKKQHCTIFAQPLNLWVYGRYNNSFSSPALILPTGPNFFSRIRASVMINTKPLPQRLLSSDSSSGTFSSSYFVAPSFSGPTDSAGSLFANRYVAQKSLPHPWEWAGVRSYNVRISLQELFSENGEVTDYSCLRTVMSV